MKLEKLNEEQMVTLVNFAARRPDLAYGPLRVIVPKEQAYEHYFEWKELARDMNYAYPEEEGNARWKSGPEWRQYWMELKRRVNRKAANIKPKDRKTKLNDYEQVIVRVGERYAKKRERVLREISLPMVDMLSAKNNKKRHS